jgi:hypothetical protein
VIPGVPITVVNSSDGAVTLSPDGTDEIDGANADLVMPVGSRMAIIGTGTAWEIMFGSPRVGDVIQEKSATYDTYSSGSSIIPDDDTIPQNNEGTPVLTCPITPLRSTSKLHVRVTFGVIHPAGSYRALAALFRDDVDDALAAVIGDTNGNLLPPLETIVDANAIDETTFKTNVGVSATGTVYINGNTANRQLGGVSKIVMTVKEIAA